MKVGYKVMQKSILLLLMLFLVGCAEPMLRPATTDPAEQITETEPLPVPQTETGVSDADTLSQITETEAATQPPVTAPISEKTVEVTGGGEIDIFGGGSDSGKNPEPMGEYAPSVLMYHLILDQPYTELTNLFVRPSEFEDHLQKLCAAGCEFLFADEYSKREKRAIILTFDDGYVDNYTEMFPILQKYGAKATVFMIAGNVNAPGYLTEDMIREMAGSGLIRFESHTLTHPSLTSLSKEGLEEQFAGSAQELYRITGRYPRAICYPGGTVNDFVMGEASRYYQFGYTTKNSADTSGCDPMAISRVRVSRGMSGTAVLNRLGWG